MAKYEFLRIIADVHGISLDELLSDHVLLDRVFTGLEESQRFLSQPLPERGRFAYIENLFREGTISEENIGVILQHNPILQADMEEIAADVKKTFSDAYGLVIPDYTLVFDRVYNAKGFVREKYPETALGTKEIFLPTENNISICGIIAHELTHAYHMENSALWGRLKLTAQHNDQNYYAMKELALYLIEGFATFMEMQYSHLCDQQKGIALYEKMQRKDIAMTALCDSHHRQLRQYYDGLDFFERIFHHKGMDGVLHVANTFTNDHQLIEYVTRQCR